jgi:hypothetical protein
VPDPERPPVVVTPPVIVASPDWKAVVERVVLLLIGVLAARLGIPTPPVPPIVISAPSAPTPAPPLAAAGPIRIEAELTLKGWTPPPEPDDKPRPKPKPKPIPQPTPVDPPPPTPDPKPVPKPVAVKQPLRAVYVWDADAKTPADADLIVSPAVRKALGDAGGYLLACPSDAPTWCGALSAPDARAFRSTNPGYPLVMLCDGDWAWVAAVTPPLDEAKVVAAIKGAGK